MISATDWRSRIVRGGPFRHETRHPGLAQPAPGAERDPHARGSYVFRGRLTSSSIKILWHMSWACRFTPNGFNTAGSYLAITNRWHCGDLPVSSSLICLTALTRRNPPNELSSHDELDKLRNSLTSCC